MLARFSTVRRTSYLLGQCSAEPPTGLARALPQLQEFLQDYSTRFFDPAYADFAVLVHCGNTDGWTRISYTLLNKGDGVLVEEFTYPTALAASHPLGVSTVGISMDSHGMRPDALEEVLANWDEEKRGFKRRVLYLAFCA